MNTIETILAADCVLLDENFPCKKNILEAISHIFAQHEPTLNERMLFKKFIERERLGSTEIGHGVALPHIRIPEINKPAACFLHLPIPIDFTELSDSKCDLILSLIVPEEDTQNHLNLLAYFANCFNSAKFREQLRSTHDRQTIIKLFAKQAHELKTAA